MDATLPDIAILRAFYPDVEIVADIEVAAPHARVRQVIGAPVSKSKLFGAGTRNLNAIRDAILRRFLQAGRAKTLIVCQQAVEDWLKKQFLPPEISVEHFNNLAGIDRYKDVGLIICVGRTMPNVMAVEAIAGALTGIQPAITGNRPSAGRPAGTTRPNA